MRRPFGCSRCRRFPKKAPDAGFASRSSSRISQSVGIDVTLRSLFNAEFFDLVYKPGHYLRKAVTFAGLSVKRLDSLRDVSRFDVILLYREMFPIGPAVIERLLGDRGGRPPIVFDFDDAIFLPSVSDANRFISALKQPGKVATIIRHSDHVIAGNEYLAAYARRFNDAVTVIPTCVDTTKFVPSPTRCEQRRAGVARAGGRLDRQSHHGALRAAAGRGVPARARAASVRPARQRRRRAARSARRADREQPPWSLDGEVRLFNTCDVGVYPLADDEWSRGKCGFKAIEFMACGVPVVASAVGVNREIIQDGVNGFLASTDDEWVEKLGRLLVDRELRRRFGEAGRRTIEERYSLQVHAPTLAATLRGVVERARHVER